MSTGASKEERQLHRPGARGSKRRLQRHGGRTVGYLVEEVADMLRVNRNAVYEMISRGEMPSVRVGRLLRIPAKPFHEKFGEPLSD
jgi:excisionase family DNA binding protein